MQLVNTKIVERSREIAPGDLINKNKLQDDDIYYNMLKWFNKNCLSNNQNLLHNKVKEKFSYDIIMDKYKNLINKI